MHKRFMIVFIVAIALIASAVYADQQAERLSQQTTVKEKPEVKEGPHAVGNRLFGNPGIMTRAPLNESFEGGAIPADWTVHNVDGDDQWEAYDASGETPPYPGAHTGSYVARCYYDTANDDWLVTPRLTVAAGDTLKFWASAYSSSYNEDFEVWVSTTGDQVADFTDMVYSQTQIPQGWAQHQVDLSTYAGSDIWVAIRCVSVYEFALYIDDVTGPEVWVPAGPAIAFSAMDLPFGTVTLPDSANLELVIYSAGASDLTVSSVVSDNAHFTHDFTGPAVITPGDSVVVTVTFTPTADPEETGTLTVTHDGTKAESYITMSGSGFSGLLFEDFLGTFPPAGWTTYELGTAGSGWAQATPGYDDDYCAWHDDFSGGTWDNWLVSPSITLPAKATYELEFQQYVRYPTYASVHSVMISSASGVPPTDFTQLYEVPHGDGYLWEPIEDLSLAAYAGQTIYLAFRYEGGYDADWSVDNAVVQEFIYVNEPPVIVHDPKGDTDDTTPTLTAIITDVEGLSRVEAFYESSPSVWTPVTMTLTGMLADEYSCDLPVGSYGTVNYYIEAEDASKGLVATTDTYSFDICEVLGLELAYDDGIVEDATVWNPGYEDNRFAVRFTPLAYPCTLNTVQIGILHGWPDDPHQQFAIEVYDDDGTAGAPGTIIYGPDTTGSVGNVVGGLPDLTGPPYPLNWAQVCIDPPLVITDGDFYVAKAQVTVNPDCEGLEVDNTTITNRAWQYDALGAAWSEVTDANYMIRAYTTGVLQYGDLGGNVGSAKAPIAGAIITAEGPETRMDTTDVNGDYFFDDLLVGDYDVTASASGYVTETIEDVVVTDGGTTTQNFTLMPWGLNDVLVVDADGSAYLPDAFVDAQAYYTDALTTCGYTYDVWEKTDQPQDGPDHTVMELYDAVVWFTGEAWQLSQTLTATDEAELGLYLDGGGKLFLSAMDYFYDRYGSYGAFSPGEFPYDYLGVTSVSQDLCSVNDPEVGHADGYAGSVAEGLAYDLDDIYTTVKGPGDKGPDDGLYIDELTIAGDAVFDADDGGTESVTIGATQYEGTGFKTVFTTVDFAGLVEGTNTRAELMCAIMDWLLAAPADMWLSDGAVDPIIGNLATPFTYTVTYTQLNDLPPTQQDVIIDGTAYAMTDPTGGSGPYAGGVEFTYMHTFDGGGDHEFHFEFSDGTLSDRLPASGELWGPMNGYFFYDFESGDGGFTATGPADDWEWGLPTAGPGTAHSGEKCWGTVLAGNYNNNSQSRLETPSLDFTLGGGDHLELKFWHWYDSEGQSYFYDGGNVKLILPDTSFIIYPDLVQADDYDTYAISSSNAWIPDEPAYSQHWATWKEAIYDLTPWTGESDVVIAFDFGSDGSVASYDGWYIDDVVIWGYPPLPVELSSFAATAGDQMVTLMWETRSEVNNLGFELYRRVGDGEFVRVTEQPIPGAGNSEATQTYTYVDRGLSNGVTYTYQLAAVDFGGDVRMHDVLVSATPTEMLPTAFALSQNYPNPFNPNTEIKYQIPEGSRVVLKIYNVTGQEVVTLMEKDLKAGYYTATWDARDVSGQQVSAGIYFCTMRAGEFSQTVKMVLLK